MTKLIVMTDLHMVPEGQTIVGLDPWLRLGRGIAHINLHLSNASAVVVTGDLAHRGDLVSYKRLKASLDLLHCPYHLLIGNHDRRDHFVASFPQQSLDESGFVQRSIATTHGILLMLDTLYAPPYDFPKSYSGMLCEQRLAWLDQQLRFAAGQPVYVFMHHPPHATGFVGMDAIALANGPEFYELLAHHGNVRHIFAGHVHRTIGGSHKGIGFSVFKSPCHQQPMVFDDTATSLSVDEPAAYGIVFLNDHGVLVHSEDYEISGVNGLLESHADVDGH